MWLTIIAILLQLLPALLNLLFRLRQSGGVLDGVKLERMNRVTQLCLQVHNAAIKVGCTPTVVNEDGTLPGDQSNA
jgi:hypothetical protein